MLGRRERSCNGDDYGWLRHGNGLTFSLWAINVPEVVGSARSRRRKPLHRWIYTSQRTPQRQSVVGVWATLSSPVLTVTVGQGGRVIELNADLIDGGAAHIASTISKIKQKAPSILVEALTPDFANKGPEVVHLVASSGLDVFAHNVETVERCTPFVRDRRAGFQQSLRVLEEAKKGAAAAGKEILTKTSIMLGVGEKGHEIEETLRGESSARRSADTQP